MSVWLTPDEVIVVIARLDGAARMVTYKQLRYWDAEGIVPAGRALASRNAARLYGADDIAMLRLAIRVLETRSLRQVSEALRYRATDLRKAFSSSRPLALTFDARGVAQVVPVYHVPVGADAYDLGECADGVSEAMRSVREHEPRVWSGVRRERPSTLAVTSVVAATV